MLVKMLNKCSVYSCLIKSALEHAGSTLPLIYQQGKSTEVWLVHLSSYKQGLALESVPDVTIIIYFALAWVFPGNQPTHISIKVKQLTSLQCLDEVYEC